MPPSWLRFLPASIQSRIQQRPHLFDVVTNTGWLFAERIVRVGVGLLVLIWLARYLGPEEFGLLSYALAFVSLFGSIAGLGLNNVVVRDLVRERESAGDILGSAFLLLVFGGVLALGLVVVAINFIRPEDNLSKLIVTLLGLGLLLKSSEVVKYWFESQVQSRYAVWVESGAYLIFAIVKITLILLNAPLVAFVWALFAEGLLAAIGLMLVYVWRGGELRAWRALSSRCKPMLKDSWPLILSGLAIMVYLKIDQIMLGQMLGDEAVGIYSAAVRISEAWYFIPAAIVASVYPAIIEARKECETLYYQRLQRLYDLMTLLGLLVALPMTFLSGFVVNWIYGEMYSQAGSVLAIHIWSSVFIFLGVASGKWFVIEGLTRLAFRRNLFGAALNIALNFVLIPAMGIVGAAIATLVSVSVAAYFSDFLFVSTRKVFVQKTKSVIGACRLLYGIFPGKNGIFCGRGTDKRDG